MKSQILVKRYAEGLAAALKTEEEYAAVSRELTEFSDILEENEELRRVLVRPFLTSDKKVQIVKDILDRQSYQAKTRRLLLLLLHHRRLEILSQIVRALPALWNERQGVIALEVRSVVPLKDSQRRKLEKELEAIEKSPVYCTYVLDPGIVGGLYVKKGNMVYDVSLKGQLERLKEKIRER